MSSTATGTLSHLKDLNNGLVGASTGYMSSLRGEWRFQIREARRLSSQVVELSALSATEMPGLVEYLEGWTEEEPPFDHVLVHGPAKNLTEDSDEILRAHLLGLPSFVEGVVVHPETLVRPQVLAVAGGRVILENMDTRKTDARTVEELDRYFGFLPEARFCLDVAHAQLNDPTLELAHELLDAFGDRLAELHLSSILPTGRHIALRPEDLRAFESVLARCTGIPWILEASVVD